MTVYTSYFGGLTTEFEPSEEADIFGVVRYPQDFVDRVTDRNIPAVAPPENLLDAYKRVEGTAEDDGADYPSAVAWRTVDFEPRYLNYLRSYPGPQRVLDELRERALERDVWLVCWEKDCRWCHRRPLASEIVADLEEIDVVHRPDPRTIDLESGSDETDENGPENAALTDFTPEA
ncbi:DUF488 family protein, N3 subclade [Halopiger goleimassiliensis]|uniref:DUF488 family protein, N3 subclade n=1 Tax=Halopiger goleimassiliensis TaxID=1293048 RepID=UPI0006778CC1|nr:DUF488 family protein [Halopiger goleimassiliensis]